MHRSTAALAAVAPPEHSSSKACKKQHPHTAKPMAQDQLILTSNTKPKPSKLKCQFFKVHRREKKAWDMGCEQNEW